MAIDVSISPHGALVVEAQAEQGASASSDSLERRILAAFDRGQAEGLLHLGTAELQSSLPPALGFARDLARLYLTRLCQTPAPGDGAEAKQVPEVAAPSADELSSLAMQAPLMKGLEYLDAAALGQWWTGLDALVREQAAAQAGGVQDWLRERNPLWRLVGRVTFHLAENKRDPDHPFAFLATYAGRLSAQGRVQHQPLGRALQEYAGAKNRPALLSLLTPVQRAAERSAFAKELVDSGQVYHPLAWRPREAYRFLQEIPALEESGLIVRVPDWWRANRPPRPVVSVKVEQRAKSIVGADALLEFSAGVTLDGEQLTEAELRAVLESAGGLVPLKGKWVEVDRDKLAEALKHWKQVEREARGGGISFFEGMRLLAGAPLAGDAADAAPEAARDWAAVSAGEALERALSELRDPAAAPPDRPPPDLRAELRPYQQVGAGWLRFLTRLGLGACLADDMGLGKTIQVLTLLLHRKREHGQPGHAATTDKTVGATAGISPPSLLVVPASLIANWKSEIARFAPTLSAVVAHPSEMPADLEHGATAPSLNTCDLVITTYGMLSRLAWLRERTWDLVILDEAQAIKNSGTRQTKAVKELKAAGRVALTGTPIENRLSDLWSLFDFLNPGLLGGPKVFKDFVKRLEQREHNPYAPLRALVRPYILRRLKTDKRVIADLPEKTEVNAYCGLSKRQAALYEHAVRQLAEQLKAADGIQRKGVVLASLMRFKQICNHPSQLSGDGAYEPEHSGKFARLRELCEELAERQEKALVFTQFREMAGPLADFLAGVFGRPGLVLHGQTPVHKRRELVDAFQRDDPHGPPFFVLSLKAGGTGLNLTAASHVIHFDRWWNPAVENQATDRAFRIGQRRNVFVHKFVCRGTVEERIDAMIAQKSGLARDLLEGAGGEQMLTEMDDRELLRFVSLDVSKAMEA